MNLLPIRYVRRKLYEHGLIPRSRLAILTAYLAGVTLILFVLQKAIQLFSSGALAGSELTAWLQGSKFFLVVLLLLLALRYARTQLMWRLRNRLLVTYVFIGVIPVVLVVTMALLAGYLFAGQFATYLATTDLDAELTRLEALNAAVAADLVGEIEASGTPSAGEIRGLRRRHVDDELSRKIEVTAWVNGKRMVMREAGLPPAELPPWFRGERFRNTVVAENGELFLVAIQRAQGSRRPVEVMARQRVDSDFLNFIGRNAQEISFLLDRSGTVVLDGQQREFGLRRQSRSSQEKASQEKDSQSKARQQKAREEKAGPAPEPSPTAISGGSIPPRAAGFDRDISFISFFPAVDFETGEARRLLLQVHTRASLLYDRLFSNSSDLAAGIRTVLIAVAIAFAVIELLALFIGMGLTRTITRSIASLYRATERINRGDLRHRIVVRSRDQLAELEKSFNSMTESLERLLAEQKEKQRIQNELAIAHEVQAQLFPREETQLRTLELHGVCRPARTVSGDYYDFLPVGYDKLALAVGDISGKGISAALLMATVHSAVRAFKLNASPEVAPDVVEALAGVRGGAGRAQSLPLLRARPDHGDSLPSPRQLLWMLNRHLYHSTPAEKYATLFLGAYDGPTQTLTYSNAGHLPPILLSKSGETRKLAEGGTVLGLFEEVEHEEGRVVLASDDLFIAYSDGITEPENEFGEFGEARLLEIVRQNRGLPLARLSEAVITAVEDWIGASEQPDDFTLVLARVRERPEGVN